MATEQSLTRNAILLALTGGIEFGLQFAIPMIFVRHLEPAVFGQYRLLWLMAGTALAIAPAFMPQSLFYFLPRADDRQKRIFIGNVLAFLAAGACVAALVGSGWNPLVPETVKSLFIHTDGLSALFLGSWIVASLMNVLPTAEGRIRWQARSDVCLAVFRTLLLAGAAIFTHDIMWVAGAMLVEALARITMLVAYLRTRDGGGQVAWQFKAMKTQLAYALPFALGNALFLLRVQADQWVVATMLPTALFATFTIGAVFLPVVSLIRQPVNNAMMPRLNKAYALGDLAEIRRLIRKSSTATALMLVPVAGALWCVAAELVQIVYTSRYAAAVPVMRVYVLSMMLSAVAVGHVLPALDKGRFAATNNACCLVISVVCSVVGAREWGLTGAAFGSVLTMGLSELWSMNVVARTLRVRLHQLLPWEALGPSLLGTFTGVAGVEILEGMMDGTAVLLLMLKGFCFLVLFSAVFFATGGATQLRVLQRARSNLREAGAGQDAAHAPLPTATGMQAGAGAGAHAGVAVPDGASHGAPPACPDSAPRAAQAARSGPAAVEVSFYEGQVPAFVERQLERLYQCMMTTVARFDIYDAAKNASTYVVRTGGDISTVFLFGRERDQVTVYNQQISLDGSDIALFAAQIFARYNSVSLVSFYAIDADVEKLPYPTQKRECLEDIVATLPASIDAYFDSLGKNTRATIKRYHKKILRDFPSFRFQVFSNQEASEQQIREIVRMSHARMAVKNQSCYHNEASTQQLLQLVRKYGMVGVITIDSRICAGAICHRVGDNYFLHVLAHNPQYDEYRLGTLCCYMSVCSAIEEGAKEYHFGWGRFDYKYKMSGKNKELYRVEIYRSRLRQLQNARRVLQTAGAAEIRRGRRWLARIELGETGSDRRLASLIKALRKIKRFFRSPVGNQVS